MYITEISETDFRKLKLVGYKRVKKTAVFKDESQYNFWIYEEVSLNDIIDKEISGGITTTVAIFMANVPTRPDNDIELFNKIPFNKYYWNDFSSFCVRDDVIKIYSKKTQWVISAGPKSEPGILSKKGIDKIYLIHIGE